ncbi:MAG: CAP domain-containing protein [Chloroflexota bacterium]
MQADLTTTPLWAPSDPDTGKQSTFAPKLRTALWHTLGSLTLAAAMLAQPMATAAPAELTSGTSPAAADMPLVATALPATGAPTQSQFFSPTGKSVAGDFLNTYQRFGLTRIGYPISNEQTENGTTVQYFERVRMERHPELASKGYSILMTRLGAEMTNGAQFDSVSPFASTKTNAFVKETGHSLAEPFLSYWKNNGSVELFGYPISEAVTQDGLRVQWFERARMEYHPELASKGQSVQLTLLGSIAYEKDGKNLTSAAQQVRPDSEPAQAKAGAEQPSTAPPAAPAAPAQTGLTDNEGYLLKAINEQRAAAGLAPVQVNSALTDLARSRSGDMATRNYFSHTTPEGSKFLDMMNSRGILYKFAGEILARNNYPDDKAAATALDSYLNSAPHKAIIMDGRYSQIGIGYSKSDEDAMHYFTVIFVQK